jgi:PleD family two-component response regulator
VNVLVVDDDAVSRLLLATAVEALGHACAVADDGESGWARYREAAPDVVVTDRVMAGMDGLELCRRIRGDAAAGYTYVVLATGLGTREDVLAGMEAGADDYLVKPVDPFELRVRLLAAERVTALHRRLEESQHALEALNTELARVASTDGLTGIGNRRRFDEDLAGLHARARRAGGSYAVAMLDIDRFKAYNDELGHQAGDAALRAVAGRVAEACR